MILYSKPMTKIRNSRTTGIKKTLLMTSRAVREEHVGLEVWLTYIDALIRDGDTEHSPNWPCSPSERVAATTAYSWPASSGKYALHSCKGANIKMLTKFHHAAQLAYTSTTGPTVRNGFISTF